ncbi:MAG: hypothetical protein J6R85_06635, partial [Lentisphaeria bacterium]|nr:hypothetical protein [Lentisphaeria bacterium]
LELLRRSQPRLYWIDAASPGCEISGGVGEARRIGMDSALAQIPWEKWGNAVIFSVDADAPAAPEYGAEVLRALQENPRCGAVAVGVRHRADDPAEEEAIRRYEQYLYDYRNRLRAAGSPYGFLTIGSAFAVRAETYAACGGMRIKAGGEDFYFLQAVRKIAEVCSVDKALIFPAGRPSGRVPFGTGPSVRSLMQGGSLPEYSDRGFAALQKLLETATEERLSQPEVFRDALFPAALTYLEQNGFFPLWEKVRRNTPKRPGALRHAFDCWFDGLRTLQFLKFAGVPEAEKNPAESDPVI